MDWADFSTETALGTLESKGLFHVGDYIAGMSHERLTSGILQGSKLWNTASGNTERRDAHQPKHSPRLARAQFTHFCCWIRGVFMQGTVPLSYSMVQPMLSGLSHSERSPSGTLLQEMEGIALQLLTL